MIINLDWQEVNVNGVLFNLKPLNAKAVETYIELTQSQLSKKDIKKIQDGEVNNYLKNQKVMDFLFNLLPTHCKIVSNLEIQEKDEIKQVSIDDIVKRDVGAFYLMRLTLATQLIQISNLTAEETDIVKKP